MVEKRPLGSGGCFGTTLDHPGWIRSILRQIVKIMFETSFSLIFAAKFLNGMVLTSNVIKIITSEVDLYLFLQRRFWGVDVNLVRLSSIIL